MQIAESLRRADRLFALHRGPKPLILPHAWDAGSAQLFVHAGAQAVGTSGFGIAWALGFSREDQLPSTDLVSAVKRICEAVAAPLSVALPKSVTDEGELRGLVDELIDAGVAGVTLGGSSDVVSRRVAAVGRRVADRRARLFINARIDDTRYDTVLNCAGACIDAGADGVSAPGLRRDDVVRLVHAIPVPVDARIDDDAWGPIVHWLTRAGVRRISLEERPLNAMIGSVRRIATEALAGRAHHERSFWNEVRCS